MAKKLFSLEDLGSFKFDSLESEPNHYPTKSPKKKKQFLEAHFSRKKRAGKVVTIIKGFQGSDQELKQLGKTLKNTVSVGGTIKNGEIIIQGNLRDKIMELLKKMGHDVKRVGG
jgi:translation initiation factor 1